MSNQTYMTLMGRSGWAVINSFHASVIESGQRPNKIVLFFESQYADAIKEVKRGLEVIQEAFSKPNVVKVEIPTSDINAVANEASECVSQEKKNNSEINLDITGGRKAIVAGSLLALKDEGLDHVHYLDIETTEGVAKPYLMIPLRIQRLLDLKTNEVQTESIEFGPKNGRTNLYISRDELQIVLNQAYRRSERIILKAPFLDLDLLRIDVEKGEVANLVDLNEYQSEVTEKNKHGIEHPDYWELCRALCFCGLLDYENVDSVRKLLTEHLAKRHSLGTGVRRAVLSLDSNMFYNGFPSCLVKMERQLSISPNDIFCVTAYPVIKEIQRRITRKYKRSDILAAKDSYEHPHVEELLDAFIGQNTLQTRRAKMARSELTRFTDRPLHERTPKVKVPKEKEKVDHLIIDQLEEFAADKDVRVTLLSTDKNMLDICELATDVGAQILRFPTSIPEKVQTTDNTLIDIIIGLALLYGVIEVQPIGYVFGEYGGKQSEVYSDEVRLRVKNLDRGRILEKRVQVCRKLSELNITK